MLVPNSQWTANKCGWEFINSCSGCFILPDSPACRLGFFQGSSGKINESQTGEKKSAGRKGNFSIFTPSSPTLPSSGNPTFPIPFFFLSTKLLWPSPTHRGKWGEPAKKNGESGENGAPDSFKKTGSFHAIKLLFLAREQVQHSVT